MNGFIPKNEISDELANILRDMRYREDRDQVPTEDFIEVDSLKRAKILDIDKERYSCRVTIRKGAVEETNSGSIFGNRNIGRSSSDMLSDKTLDRHYDHLPFGVEKQLRDELEIEKRKKKEQENTASKTRDILHEYFKNISPTRAVREMQEMNVGDCIFFPHRNGYSHLSLIYKYGADVDNFIRATIQEKGKKLGNSKLGPELIIDGESYESLDEIMVRFVQVRCAYLADLLSHRKYQHKYKDRNQVDTYLTQCRIDKPKQPHYCISRHMENIFHIAYVKGTKIHRLYFKVNSEGYELSLTYDGSTPIRFTDVEKLLNWFKRKGYKDAPRREILGANGSSSRHSRNPESSRRKNDGGGRDSYTGRDRSSNRDGGDRDSGSSRNDDRRDTGTGWGSYNYQRQDDRYGGNRPPPPPPSRRDGGGSGW